MTSRGGPHRHDLVDASAVFAVVLPFNLALSPTSYPPMMTSHA
jgi:hypothetical protein